MKNILNKKVDRLPVKITYKDVDQLLGVPVTEGSGESEAGAVYDLLKIWDEMNFVQACCFDTTSVNTGHLAGAATVLERLLKRNLLWIPCRHHIYELCLKAIFEDQVKNLEILKTANNTKYSTRWK